MIYDQFPSKVLPVQLFLTDSAMAQAMAAIPPYTPMILTSGDKVGSQLLVKLDVVVLVGIISDAVLSIMTATAGNFFLLSMTQLA